MLPPFNEIASLGYSVWALWFVCFLFLMLWFEAQAQYILDNTTTGNSLNRLAEASILTIWYRLAAYICKVTLRDVQVWKVGKGEFSLVALPHSHHFTADTNEETLSPCRLRFC